MNMLTFQSTFGTRHKCHMQLYFPGKQWNQLTLALGPIKRWTRHMLQKSVGLKMRFFLWWKKSFQLMTDGIVRNGKHSPLLALLGLLGRQLDFMWKQILPISSISISESVEFERCELKDAGCSKWCSRCISISWARKVPSSWGIRFVHFSNNHLKWCSCHQIACSQVQLELHLPNKNNSNGSDEPFCSFKMAYEWQKYTKWLTI